MRRSTPTTSPSTFRWDLPADLDRVPSLVFDVSRVLATRCVEERPVYVAQLAIEEIVSNAIRHGRAARDIVIVRVTMSLDGDRLVLSFEDEGEPFDSTRDGPTPDLSASLEQRDEGGLGLYLVRRFVDSLDYERRGSTNFLRAEIHRPGHKDAV